MKTLIYLLILIMLTSCGKVKMQLEDKKTKEIEDNNPIIAAIINKDRVVKKFNQEIPIQSYDDGSITGSGLFYQSNIIPPQMWGNKTLKMQGFAQTEDIAYISYHSDDSDYSVIDFVSISDPQNIKIVYSLVNKDYQFGLMAFL